MADPSNPLALLVASRRAFAGTSDGDSLIRVVDSLLPKGAIRWLEVGAGDGRNLAILVEHVGRERSIQVTAVDPSADLPARPMRAHVDWIRSSIEDVDLAGPYEWINVRHSAYYFEDALSQILRLVGALASGGGLTLTHWSHHCVLYRLHCAALAGGAADPCPTFEEIVQSADGDAPFELGHSELCTTALDVNAVFDDEGVAAALYGLALRGRGGPKQLSKLEQIAFVRTFLSADSNQSRRVNGIAVLRSQGS